MNPVLIRARGSIVALVALGVLSAGCVGGLAPSGGEEEPVDPASRPSATGAPQASLAVEVTDPALTPITGANVTVETQDGAHRAETGASGATSLDDLAPGSAILTVQAPEHRGRQLTIELPAGERVHHRIVLQPTPENGTFVQRFAFEGFFECSATYLIITGDCLAPARAVGEEVGVWPGTNATNARFVFPFPVEPGWSTIHITQTWEDPAAGVGSAMRLNLEPLDPNHTEGHSPQYAEVDGTSPIELTVHAGQAHPSAEPSDLVPPADGGGFRTRTFHLGLAETQDPAGTGFLGAGAAIQQPFTVTVEVVYG